ncbi:hypothetical protein PVK06_019499 [Gossypium arboreum]|uniref:Uncharacterized protein n=1 Tax=Gossypium arboreum TaxID=29729 RepID=A0ABR0PJW9_GOSAR|nr:hypothetical protein PVK06_019499 [Gossypium arboreum]
MYRRSIGDRFTSKELYDAPLLPDTAKIDSLVEGELITGKEVPTAKEEVSMKKEVVRVEVLNKKSEEENTDTEVVEKESVEDIVNVSKFVDVTKDNLTEDGARLVEVVEATSEEHHNSLAIVVYTGPLKVTLPTQEAVDDVGA